MERRKRIKRKYAKKEGKMEGERIIKEIGEGT